jgi:hypothetical protein
MEEYVVEAILGERRVRRRGRTVVQYKVKWEGFEEPTWEPTSNLKNCKDELDAYKKRVQGETAAELGAHDERAGFSVQVNHQGDEASEEAVLVAANALDVLENFAVGDDDKVAGGAAEENEDVSMWTMIMVLKLMKMRAVGTRMRTLMMTRTWTMKLRRLSAKNDSSCRRVARRSSTRRNGADTMSCRGSLLQI